MKKNNSIVYGTRPVAEAIDAGKEISRVLIRKGLQNEYFLSVFQKIKESGIPYQYVPNEKLNRITQGNHQGIVAYVSAVEFIRLEEIVRNAFEQGHDPFIIILDGITDVRNFGAIARTAECAGADAIVVPEKGSVTITPDAIKTSAGALNHIAVSRTPDLFQTLKFLKDSGIRIIAASEKSENNYFKADLTGPLALIMGSEDTGISSKLLNFSDEIVRIPLQGIIKSLNVGVALGILTFEVVRQRTGPTG